MLNPSKHQLSLYENGKNWIHVGYFGKNKGYVVRRSSFQQGLCLNTFVTMRATLTEAIKAADEL